MSTASDVLPAAEARADVRQANNTTKERRMGSMSKYPYTVFYTAIATGEGNHLFAAGWTHRAGLAVKLVPKGQTDNFILEVCADEDVGAQVLTPFEVAARIGGDPRSVFVQDDYGRHQVQVCGVQPGESGANTPGIWVRSGEKTN